jgi:hypothetical protein
MPYHATRSEVLTALIVMIIVLIGACGKPHADANLPAAPSLSATGHRYIHVDESTCHQDEGLKCGHKDELPVGVAEVRTKMLCCKAYVDDTAVVR